MLKLISGNNNVYELELDEFLERQSMIQQKYMHKLSNNTSMEILDKYILQIFEEMWEVDNAPDPLSRIKELCDVLMYTGSLYTIIEEKIGVKVPIEGFIIISPEDQVLDLNKIRNQLISLRRFYPERKWHKNETSIGEVVNKISLEILSDIIKDIINDL